MDIEKELASEGKRRGLIVKLKRKEIDTPEEDDDDDQVEEKGESVSNSNCDDTNSPSPLERICRVLSSKNKMDEANGNGDDDQEDEKGESLPNPVTSAMQFRYKCDKCEQSFSSKGSCWNHKKRAHPTEDDLTKHWHTCEKCGKSFFYRKQYENHCNSCQGQSDGKTATLIRCPMCPFTCFEKVDLADHVVEHENNDGDDVASDGPPALSPFRESNGQYEADLPPPSPSLFIDETDSMLADIESVLVQSEKGTWQCPSCPIRCTEKEDVIAHMKDRHLNKVRKHICNICNRAFTHSSGLKQHITRVHGVPGPPPDPDGAKFFKCGLCGKAFSVVRSLISHWPTHKLQTSSSLENFQCIICKAFFQLPSQLQDHFIKQHPQEATSGSFIATPTAEKRPLPDDSPSQHPPIKMEKLDEEDSRDSSRGMPGFLSRRQYQGSFDSDDQPTPQPSRKARATTSTPSSASRNNHSYQTSSTSRDADADAPSSMSGATKEDDDTEPSSSQSCVSCMEKSGHLLSSCKHCGIYFTDFVMHTLHMGLHGQEHPFQCHHCGKNCGDKYNFFTHVYREPHL